MNLSTWLLLLLVSSMLLNGMSCTPTPNPDELDRLGTVPMTIHGQPFKLWIADEAGEQANGLMFVSAERMAPLPEGVQRGMIFVFDYEHELSFWMRNTIISLDIAYLDSDGVVVSTYTMAALDDRLGRYSSGSPARYAIEVNAGVWKQIGLKAGDRVEIPASLLNRKP